MGVEPKIGGDIPPNHPLKNRVFHEINHPFWGIPIFGNTQNLYWVLDVSCLLFQWHLIFFSQLKTIRSCHAIQIHCSDDMNEYKYLLICIFICLKFLYLSSLTLFDPGLRSPRFAFLVEPPICKKKLLVNISSRLLETYIKSSKNASLGAQLGGDTHLKSIIAPLNSHLALRGFDGELLNFWFPWGCMLLLASQPLALVHRFLWNRSSVLLHGLPSDLGKSDGSHREQDQRPVFQQIFEKLT